MSAPAVAAVALAAGAGWMLWSSPPTRRWRWLEPSPPRLRLPPGLLLGAAVGCVVAVILGPVAGLAGGAASAGVAHRGLPRFARPAERRRLDLIASQSPLALDLLAAALDAGRPPVDAFAAVARCTADPLGAELDGIARRLAVATDPAKVWRQVADGPLGPIGRAFARTEASGLAVARVVSQAAVELRREQRSVREERAERLSVTTTVPLGLCFLPAFFLVGVVPMLIGLVGGLIPG